MTDYNKQATDFLTKANATMKITRVAIVDRFPNCDDHRTGYRWKYRITLHRNGKYYTFNFYDSINNYMEDKRPAKYDVLACLEKYNPRGDAWDFAREYGYTIESREDFNRIERIRKGCEKQYKKLLDLFGAELLEELQEIN